MDFNLVVNNLKPKNLKPQVTNRIELFTHFFDISLECT
jgi:hypothetical protein